MVSLGLFLGKLLLFFASGHEPFLLYFSTGVPALDLSISDDRTLSRHWLGNKHWYGGLGRLFQREAVIDSLPFLRAMFIFIECG